MRVGLGPLRRQFEQLSYWWFVKRSGLPLYPASATDCLSRELAFVDIFRQQQVASSWLKGPFFPIGGAANTALLSMLARGLDECDFQTVLEFGAGQSTRVLAAWARTTGRQVFTVEEDAGWADQLRRTAGGPSHQVLHIPLTRLPTGELWYDPGLLKAKLGGCRADLILVDGPIGTRRRSRAGLLTEFHNLHRPEWAISFGTT